MTQVLKSKIKLVNLTAIALMLVFTPVLISTSSHASPILNRKLTLSSSVGDASNVNYTFTTSSALPTSSTPIKSVEIDFCNSLTDSCATSPSGFSSLSSTLASQPSGLGSITGWTVDNSNSSSLRIVNASNSTNPSGSVSISWDGVHNPTANNQTFYAIITTYSSSDWTGAIDSGSVALSTSEDIEVTFTVDETLTFCTGTSITGQNCGTVSGNIVDLGKGSISATSVGTSVISAATNGTTGYSINVSGSTLTSGDNTITAMSSGGASTVGSRQFGLNLVGGNTTPVVGASVTGTGTGFVGSGYDMANNFRFVTGETIASASGPTNANTFTVSYIANIDGSTPAGTYTTILNYTATANF